MIGIDMPKSYIIPEDAPESVLIDLHREILITNPRVRCHFKWGDFTEYSVKINQRDVEHLAGREIATINPFRLNVGVDCEYEDASDAPITTILEVWDAEQREWVAALDMLNAETLGIAMDIDEYGFLQRCAEYVEQKYPELVALIEIDILMFRKRGKL